MKNISHSIFYKLLSFTLISILFTCVNFVFAQSKSNNNKQKRSQNEMRIMFYNVENLFDPRKDSLKMDDEYTPTGMRGWTYQKMQRKQLNISKVVLAVGGFRPPEIIGLCEIENRSVLHGLVSNTPLKNFGYKIVHFESPDARGIDVALLYMEDHFKPVHYKPINIRFPFDTLSKTRDILYVKGATNSQDTLHIFVNHWPSKFGGAMATIPKRNFVASVLRNKVDSLMNINSQAKIIIMGDLNDGPKEMSVLEVLGATLDSTNIAANDLYNMVAGSGCKWDRGTVKFREEWDVIDHIIVSPALLPSQKTGLRSKSYGLTIFDAPFLFEDDEIWFGKKPFRTYYGAKYLGGYSDHLPVYMDFEF